MVQVPAIVFYAGTAAMIIVCALLAVFLFYLIKAARMALGIITFLEEERRRLETGLGYIRRATRLVAAFFHD